MFLAPVIDRRGRGIKLLTWEQWETPSYVIDRKAVEVGEEPIMGGRAGKRIRIAVVEDRERVQEER